MAFNYAKEDVAKSAVVNVEDATTKIKELIIKGVNSGVAKEQILDDTKRIIAYCIKNIEHIKDKEIVMRSLWNNANQVLYEYTRAVKVFSTNAYNRAVDLGFMNDTYSYDGKVIDKIRNLIDSEKKEMINPIIEDYQKKIRSTIRVLSAEAPFAVETTPSGHTSKMGIRVRAEMKVRYEANMAELERYKTEGVKLVWITSHPNCSPRCKDYQGKLYSLDGTRGNINGIKYEPIEEALAGPYGDGNGCISGYNCRHRLAEYKEGSKAPIEYTEYEIKRAYALDKQQRSIEGGIRQLKVEEKLLRASGNNAAAKVLRLKWQALTKEYEVFCLTNKRPISRWRCVVSKEELENSNLAIDNDIDMNYNKNSGALNDSNDPNRYRRDKHAFMYYQTIRNSKIEPIIDKVSKNTGIDKILVEKMFTHLFVNKYKLEKGVGHFDPDFDMAQSIQRLIEGKIIYEHDTILVYHEALEYDLMKKHPEYSYNEAHDITNETYNYTYAIIKWKKEKGEI